VSTESKSAGQIYKRVDKIRGFVRDQFDFLRQDRLAMLGVIVVAGFVFLGLFGPMLAPNDPIEDDVRGEDGSILRLSEPSGEAAFGTTAFGKDVLSQFLAGARPTFIFGLFGVVSLGWTAYFKWQIAPQFRPDEDEEEEEEPETPRPPTVEE
jgi:peptide/nickel transport system permease protein